MDLRLDCVTVRWACAHAVSSLRVAGGRLDARAVLRLPVLLVQPGRSERESVAQPVALARFRRDDVFLANNVCCVCVRVCVSARLRLFARD